MLQVVTAETDENANSRYNLRKPGKSPDKNISLEPPTRTAHTTREEKQKSGVKDCG